MAKRQIFYSFHYGNDVMRVQQIRNIGALEANAPVSPNEWEQIKAKGDAAVEKWIADNMSYRSCVVVLIGQETARRPWVRYEIRKAWTEGKGLFGIYIHNINCPRNGPCSKGTNPFDSFTVAGEPMSSLVQCYDPPASTAYATIGQNMEQWVENAIAAARSR